MNNMLELGTSIHGFVIESHTPLPEIDGDVFIMRHTASGARLMFLQNDDINKAFSISFKTPPADSTGVFHILEHSVLCGSRKFPVKEPFVNLIKSSMQTFLNAMTFSDKTMYPVASTNEQDLLNLMDVYLDAVFYPAIYEKRTIFEQEGWHYEIDDTDAPLRYNGVVYNEMKGALSDPESVLYNTLSEALFPDTAYAHESGGDPACIPQLSYEQFLDEHTRHYRLSNSYTVLYGNLDIARVLAFLDENYFSDQELICRGSEPGVTATASHTNNPINPLTIQAPVENLHAHKQMETAPENACVGMGFVVGTARERLRIIATEILVDVLMGSNEAPLKKALLKQGFADNIEAYLVDAQLQPAVYIIARGTKPNSAETMRATVENTCTELTENGIDPQRIEASIAHMEFKLRERDWGIAEGVMLSMCAMAGWLYDDALALDYIRYEDALSDLRTAAAEGYFEQLLHELVLENTHRALAVLEPVERLDEENEAARLARIRATLSNADIEDIMRNEAALRAAQEEPDSPEALASLPMLSLADIAQAPAQLPEPHIINSDKLTYIHHELPTRGINYLYVYFELDRLNFEELPYAMLLASLFGKLDTAKHSAAELDKLTQSKLGMLNFSAAIYEDDQNPESCRAMFAVRTSALTTNMEYLATLPAEVWQETRFDDVDAIRDILVQIRSGLEMSYTMSGNSAAAMRCASYYSKPALLRETLRGVHFYLFIKDLLENFDEQFPAISAKLADVSRRIFSLNGATLSFTGTTEELQAFRNLAGTFALPNCSDTPTLRIPEPIEHNEAFIVPADVSFAVAGTNMQPLDTQHISSWMVARKALSFDFLWNEVRVKGGAYGAGFSINRTGNAHYYSYRDPALDSTIQRFCEAGSWLANFTASESEMTGYIISTAAGLDTPIKPRAAARRQDAEFFSKRPQGWQLEVRNAILNTTTEDLRACGERLMQASESFSRCVFGPRAAIEASQLSWKNVSLFGEGNSDGEGDEA